MPAGWAASREVPAIHGGGGSTENPQGGLWCGLMDWSRLQCEFMGLNLWDLWALEFLSWGFHSPEQTLEFHSLERTLGFLFLEWTLESLPLELIQDVGIEEWSASIEKPNFSVRSALLDTAFWPRERLEKLVWQSQWPQKQSLRELALEDFSGTDSGAGTRSDEHGKSSEVASGSVKTAGAWCQDDWSGLGWLWLSGDGLFIHLAHSDGRTIQPQHILNIPCWEHMVVVPGPCRKRSIIQTRQEDGLKGTITIHDS